MQNPLRILLIAGVGALIVGCASDNATSPVGSSAAARALVTAPISFDQVNTSFVGSSNQGTGFVPTGPGFSADDDNAENEEGDHDNAEDVNGTHEDHGPGWGALMGGGIGEGFIGAIGFRRGFERGPFGDLRDSGNCAFSSTTNRVECASQTHGGLNVTRSYSLLDASGAVQQAYVPGTTNTVNVKTTVAGTRTHHNTATSTVSSSSDFTVAGLATGSTTRTVDGKSAGTESTTGTRDNVAFTAERTAGDTISGLVIPLQDGRPTYPTAGTITRSMKATVTLAGSSPSTTSRREVITFDGSATATIVITQDGVTKNCTKPLPHGRLSCS